MLKILLADDEDIIHQTIGEYLTDCGHQADEARNGAEALTLAETREYDLAIVDIRMPDMDGIALMRKILEIDPVMPVVIITGHGNMETVIQALRTGAADFLPKPVKLLELDAVLEKCHHIRQLRKERHHLHKAIGAMQRPADLRGQTRKFTGMSRAARKIREQIRMAAASGCDTILITGETGTGKEVAARHIHALAGADEKPFIAVNCPALPESLFESELFGHVKGAFTGAAQNRAGYFELADGGTLFLDEIAEMPPSFQAKLLRVLETRAFRPVGGAREIQVNIRLIAATNADLEKEIRAGRFRQDLYYRLNLYMIHLMPLRERREDILPLAEHFLSLYATGHRLHCHGFSPEAGEMLHAYDFPGNVRELRNIVERAAIICRSPRIRPEDLSIRSAADTVPTGFSPVPDADNGRERMLRALEKARWNRRQAAKLLGISYPALRYRMKKYGL